MTHRLIPVLLLLGLALAATGMAQAQSRRPSHIPIDGGVNPEDADLFLRHRLNNAQTVGELEKLARDILRNPEKYKLSEEERRRLLRGGVNPNDPEMQRTLERLLQGEGGASIPPEQLERWREALGRMREGPEGGPATTTPSSPEPGPAPQPPTPPDSPELPPRGRPAPGSGDSEPPPRLAGPSGPAGEPDAWSDRLRRLGEKLSQTPLAESSALRRMVLNMERVGPAGTDSDSDWARRRDALTGRLSALGDRLAETRWPRLNGRIGRDLRMPRLASPSVGMPSVSVPESDDVGNAVLVVVGLGLFGLLLAVVARARGRMRVLQAERARLGPWPVRPEAVATREELVRAFDYLALLLLGPAAKAWNHRDVAVHLGRSPDRRLAADRLAGLYERARYAPPEEPLPEPELAAARGDLRFLAGAAAA